MTTHRYCAILLLLSSLLQSFAQLTWIQTSAPTNAWSGIAMSADATKLFATAGDSFNGQPSYIYLSTDSGATWTPSSAPTNKWTSIACSADGTKLVAIAKGSLIYTSTNSGATWISNDVPKLSWRSVASSADGARLFVLTTFGQYYRSTNFGASWISNSAPGGSWTITCSPNGANLLTAAGNSSPRSICSSIDAGVTWITNVTTNWIIGTVAQSFDGTRLFAGDGSGSSLGLMYRSLDGGTTWGTNNSPMGLWQSTACSVDGMTVVAGNWQGSGYPLGAVYTSTNGGGNWISNNVPVHGWRSVTCSADGSVFAAVADRSGPTLSDIAKGSIWIARKTPTPQVHLTTLSNSFTLSWTVPATNCLLQQTSELTGTNWENVLTTPELNLTNLEKQVTLPGSTNRLFFRLATP